MAEPRNELEYITLQKFSNLLDTVHLYLAALTRKTVAEAVIAEIVAKKQMPKGEVN